MAEKSLCVNAGALSSMTKQKPDFLPFLVSSPSGETLLEAKRRPGPFTLSHSREDEREYLLWIQCVRERLGTVVIIRAGKPLNRSVSGVLGIQSKGQPGTMASLRLTDKREKVLEKKYTELVASSPQSSWQSLALGVCKQEHCKCFMFFFQRTSTGTVGGNAIQWGKDVVIQQDYSVQTCCTVLMHCPTDMMPKVT